MKNKLIIEKISSHDPYTHHFGKPFTGISITRGRMSEQTKEYKRNRNEPYLEEPYIRITITNRTTVAFKYFTHGRKEGKAGNSTLIYKADRSVSSVNSTVNPSYTDIQEFDDRTYTYRHHTRHNKDFKEYTLFKGWLEDPKGFLIDFLNFATNNAKTPLTTVKQTVALLHEFIDIYNKPLIRHLRNKNEY